ncbi:MAG TPA: ATP-binding protein, partial [Draconibacterium sp.]|nr:ATP-binding protein [Draconibacterium sp.]
ALDRVRGEIASMRSKEDLTLITPLIWKELNSLGVSFIRCGVLIMDENKKIIHTYLSKPNGDSLSAFELSFDSKEIGVGAVKHWKRNEIYYEYWDKNQFVSFMQNLIKTGQIENPESYQGDYEPPESLFLHLVPFKQGMLYVGNTNSLKPEEIQLVQALAQTMSVAYSRYEDFRLLEEAKNQIEKTLIVLKSTQSQLIQAEKMASLGELTAGIAHEIQNPLNFVNNFSEVSRELIEEMKEELTEGSKQYAAGSLQSGEDKLKLANEIADDLELNLEKINQHGNRAADIVKGMLQHSRTGSGQKELTDINTLADEYLRLAYHGLKAKDKSFGADFKIEFDTKLPKINVVPQDIGRVLLNLINNAFYAVNERSQKGEKGYKPTVFVSTAKIGDKLEVKITDNGHGIPENIKEKIFQPFFTTKPTGSGTGLGLSLSYDIVKAHGGTINVVSELNVGTEFIINLPV